MLHIRLCSALLSAYLFAAYLPNPAFLLWRLSPCADSRGDDCDVEFAWYGRLAAVLSVSAGLLWVAAWVSLETSARRRSTPQRPRLLSHLRYGPVAVLLLSVFAVVATDEVLIRYSRRQIVRYIRGDAPPRERPSFELHNDDRGWCGNGMAAREYALYGATPAAHYDDPDPAVRARAVRASAYVYDWLNNPGRGPSVEVLTKAKNDPDPLVREVAAEHFGEF
ncbi:MAG TPA: hypothetical protein VF591_06715 [Pyrinomonadaceae bacterium]|jgi:hypothetical protein